MESHFLFFFMPAIHIIYHFIHVLLKTMLLKLRTFQTVILFLSLCFVCFLSVLGIFPDVL